MPIKTPPIMKTTPIIKTTPKMNKPKIIPTKMYKTSQKLKEPQHTKSVSSKYCVFKGAYFSRSGPVSHWLGV